MKLCIPPRSILVFISLVIICMGIYGLFKEFTSEEIHPDVPRYVEGMIMFGIFILLVVGFGMLLYSIFANLSGYTQNRVAVINVGFWLIMFGFLPVPIMEITGVANTPTTGMLRVILGTGGVAFGVGVLTLGYAFTQPLLHRIFMGTGN